jgi:hypothetical protein
MNAYAASALGGLLATVPMTVVMTKLFQKLPSSQQYPLPPREITETVLSHTSAYDRLSNRDLTYLCLAAHFAYGTATGALYPLLFRSPRYPAVAGAGYGVAVWLSGLAACDAHSALCYGPSKVQVS